MRATNIFYLSDTIACTDTSYTSAARDRRSRRPLVTQSLYHKESRRLARLTHELSAAMILVVAFAGRCVSTVGPTQRLSTFTVTPSHSPAHSTN